ncbi:MAG: hypothetical protein WC378_13260 [Opitutaceae bacterium]|jgi:hypothetical protein
MLFSPKIRGFFVEKNDHSWMMARVSSLALPFVVEELKEIPLSDVEGLKTASQQLLAGKSQSGYLNAVCGINPPKRLIRRATVEIKRAKEPNYLNEVCVQQLRIEPDKFTLAALNASDGSEFDLNKPAGKEIVICGMPSEDIVSMQDSLLQSSIYPTRIELGTVASLGAAIDYLSTIDNKAPTLLLEIGSESTQSFIIGTNGVETSRPIPYGIDAMIPVVHKKLNLKDEESARKLFLSNTFDFTSMGPELVQRLLKELQSSIGFYEVQTGQSISQLICISLPPKLGWIETAIAGSLGVTAVKVDLVSWLKSHRIALSENASRVGIDSRWFGLFSLMVSYHNPEAANAAPAEKKA